MNVIIITAFTQKDGKFQGGDETTNMNINGTMTLSGGIFTAPRGTMYLKFNFNYNTGIFNHNNGTLEFI